jgi:thioesterase domain-containing protein/acyl carrier protein
MRPDGLLEHLGRLDTRVKVRGAMVATSEVEIALMRLDGVADAAVIAVDGDDGGTRLVAYVVADGSVPLSAWRLRRDVATLVPTTMVPSAFVAIDTLPRTVRHKIDRAALPPPPAPARRPYRAPADEFFEVRLADLFAEVLGVERVGVDDDFFELGGDSLGVLELLAAIHEVFAIELPARAVLEAPTVAQLAPRLVQRRAPGASPVVALQAAGDGRPVFCVPGGGAPALALRALARTVEGHPFYGVQALGLEERGSPDRTVEAIAARNVEAIRAVQAHGPYVLGGHSFGGFVAFEMACLLRAAGEEVDPLVMLDAGAPLGPQGLREHMRRAPARLRATSELGIVYPAVLAAHAVVVFPRSAFERARERVVAASAGRVTRHGLAQYEAFYELHVVAAKRYRPSTTFDGHIVVLRAGGDDDLGWSELTTGPVTVVRVPGDHLSLLRPPAVREVGRRLSEILG